MSKAKASTKSAKSSGAPKIRALSAVPASTLNQTTLNITSVSGDGVGVSYSGLTGNNPGTNNNFIVIFQNPSPNFPFGTTAQPVTTYPVNGDPSGSIIIPATITDQSFVLGYSVGPLLKAPNQPYGNVCATAFIPSSGNTYPSLAPSMSLVSYSSNAIMCNYSVPDGLLPKGNGAWAGIWVGNTPSYYNPPSTFVAINSNAATGGPLIFNGLRIGRGAMVSIGLFMSGWVAGGVGSLLGPMACTLQFTAPS